MVKLTRTRPGPPQSQHYRGHTPTCGATDLLVYELTRDGNWKLHPSPFSRGIGIRTRLTNNPADYLNAFWSPDGSRLVFQSNRSGRWQLYELNWQMAMLRLLSDGSGDDMDGAYANNGLLLLLLGSPVMAPSSR